MFKILEKAGITLELIFSFVDDIRLALLALRTGVDFCPECKEFTSRKAQKEADNKSSETDTARTARVMNKVFNCVESDLRFTVQTQEEYADGYSS